MITLLSLAPVALAGELDGLIALDGLTATSKASGEATGPSETLSHTDLGIRVRMTLRELDDRATVRLDYRGREALTGTFPNRTLRLLYRAEAAYEVVEDRLTVGVGRFHTPLPTFTIIDGASLRWTNQTVHISGFGGRRAISASRLNLGGLLPVVGLDAGYSTKTFTLDATLGYAEDDVLIGGTGASEAVGGASGQVRVSARPTDTVRFGAHTSLIQGATYAIGPTWAEGIAEATALGLFQASGWLSVQPSDPIRWDLDVAHQNMQSWGTGLVGDEEPIVRPTFTDFRTRVRLGPPKVGWLEPSVRYRIRPNWSELRVAVRFDVHDFGVPGLYLRTRGAFDDIRGDGVGQDVGSRDRTFGAASVGFRHLGFDGALGASYVQRGAKPVSSRSIQSSTSDDLAPFVLEADPIASARLFYSGKRWFTGADLEKHLSEPEFRAFLQVGVLTEVGW